MAYHLATPFMSQTRTYARASRASSSSSVFVCSPYRVSYGLLREDSLLPDKTGAWESFAESSVSHYFTHASEGLRMQLAKIEDVSKPYSVDEEREFLFMAEAVSHSRRLVDACREDSASCA
jgi:hypothetical protein